MEKTLSSRRGNAEAPEASPELNQRRTHIPAADVERVRLMLRKLPPAGGNPLSYRAIVEALYEDIHAARRERVSWKKIHATITTKVSVNARTLQLHYAQIRKEREKGTGTR